MACEVKPDPAEILRDLVRNHGRTFHSRAKFCEGAAYHRELVHTGPGFEAWLLSWLPGQVTPIHDHGGVVTISTVLSGAVFEERFERTRGALVRPTWTTLRATGDVDPIDPLAIHRMQPVGSAVTLHLYLPASVDGQIYQAVA